MTAGLLLLFKEEYPPQAGEVVGVSLKKLQPFRLASLATFP